MNTNKLNPKHVEFLRTFYTWKEIARFLRLKTDKVTVKHLRDSINKAIAKGYPAEKWGKKFARLYEKRRAEKLPTPLPVRQYKKKSVILPQPTEPSRYVEEVYDEESAYSGEIPPEELRYLERRLEQRPDERETVTTKQVIRALVSVFPPREFKVPEKELIDVPTLFCYDGEYNNDKRSIFDIYMVAFGFIPGESIADTAELKYLAGRGTIALEEYEDEVPTDSLAGYLINYEELKMKDYRNIEHLKIHEWLNNLIDEKGIEESGVIVCNYWRVRFNMTVEPQTPASALLHAERLAEQAIAQANKNSQDTSGLNWILGGVYAVTGYLYKTDYKQNPPKKGRSKK